MLQSQGQARSLQCSQQLNPILQTHIYLQALLSAPSSAQLLIRVGDNAVNAHGVLHMSPELFPAPPGLPSLAHKCREWVMGAPHAVKHIKTRDRLLQEKVLVGVHFFSKLCRKEG